MESEFDIVVVGGGIAGLNAGLTAARLGRRTLVLTGAMLGGHLISIEKIEGYPGFSDGVAGYELCPTVQAQAADAGAEFALAEMRTLTRRGESWCVAADSGEYLARAVIAATGTSLRELGVPGETLLRGKGVSHCASCDAPLLKGRRVVVVGGGDSALQEALRLADDAAEVEIVHRHAQPVAQAAFVEQVATVRKIIMRPNAEVDSIHGEDAVTGVRVRHVDDGTVADLEADGVFVYIGLEPNSACWGSPIAMSHGSGIRTDESQRTRLEGVFAAGTVRAGSAGRAAAAAGEGASAALSADRYLRGATWPADRQRD